jgi:hypothetical protein
MSMGMRAAYVAWRPTLAATAVAALFVIGLAMDAVAQVAPDPSNARGHLGPFSFNPGLVSSTGYDTNPYREAGAGSDVETYVVPQIDGWLDVGRLRANLFGAIELVRFANRNGARNYQYGARNTWQSLRLTPFLDITSKHTNANPTGFEVGRKSLRNETDLRAGVRVHLGGPLYASTYYRRTKTSWDADAIYQTSSLREKLNRTDTAIGAGVEYELTPLTSLRFQADTNTSDFVYSPIRNGSGYRIGPGITLRGPAAIVANADVGIRSFTSTTSGVNFNGPVSSILVSRMFPSETYIAFRLDRDLQFSYDTELEYFVARSLELSVIQALGESMAVQAFAGHHTLAYDIVTPGKVPVNAVNEYGVALGHRLGQAMRVGMSVERAQAAGNQPWKELRFTGFLTYGFGAFQRLDRPIPFQR